MADGLLAPYFPSHGGQDAIPCQVLRNPVAGLPGQEFMIDPPDDGRLLRIHKDLTLRSPPIAQKGRKGDGDLYFIQPLPLAPGAVLGDRTRFFLGNGGHDGQKELARPVEGPDPLFFKIALDPVLLQPPSILIRSTI